MWVRTPAEAGIKTALFFGGLFRENACDVSPRVIRGEGSSRISTFKGSSQSYGNGRTLSCATLCSMNNALK